MKVNGNVVCFIASIKSTIIILLFATLMVPLIAQNTQYTNFDTSNFNELLNNWNNPPNIYRPVQIIHHYMPSSKEAVHIYLDEAEIRRLGGFVVNMGKIGDPEELNRSYLVDDAAWKTLRQFMTMALQRDFRIWLYDENGYPSGSAGGLVYEGNPDYHVSGVICQSEETEGGKGEMILDVGEILSIVAIPYHGGKLSYANKIILNQDQNEGRVTWDLPNGDWKILVFIYKDLDWPTNTGNPYVDLLDPSVTEKFIRTTHHRYIDQLGTELFDQIEAIFTDEPAFAVNGAGGLRESYPLVPWTDSLEIKFYEEYGYSIVELLPKLFHETLEPFENTRMDFWGLVTKLFEDSYFKQIGDWSNENGIEFTGHIFGEESLARQMGTTGNMFSVLRNMQMPGVDRLYSTNTEDVIAEKTASSAAHLMGRNNVMSESGCHYEISRWKIPFDIWDIINTATHQYVLGINSIASYYKMDKISAEDRAMYQEYVGRLGSMLEGAKHIAPVLVHIPMEGIWANYQPKTNRYWEYGPGHVSIDQTPKVKEIERTYGFLLRGLMDAQWDYDLIDDKGICDCMVEDSSDIFTGKEAYKSLVIIDHGHFSPMIRECLDRINKSGGKIIVVQMDVNVISPVFEEGCPDILIAKNWREVPILLDNSIEKDFVLKEDNKNIWYQYKKHNDFDIYLIYNRSLEVQEIDVEIGDTGMLLKMDPLTGEIDNLKVGESVTIDVPARRGLFLVKVAD